MNCANCGKKMSSEREVLKYDACGLDYVSLVNVQVWRCAGCGEVEPVIPRIAELHLVLARIVAHSPGQLRGPEIRFLRKYLGYSAVEAARALSVRPETLSRWENDKVPISEGAERLLRLMIANQQPSEFYPLDKLLADRPDKKPSQIRLRGDTSWKPAQAVAR